MNVWEPLVDSSDSRTLLCLLGSFNKITKCLLPVHSHLKSVKDVFPTTGRDTSPRASLTCFVGCLLDGFLQSLFSNFIFSIIHLIPARVVIKRIRWSALATFSAFTLGVVHRLPVGFVPLVGLPRLCPLKRLLPRDAAFVGQLPNQVRVDGEVHTHVVFASQPAFGLTTGDVLEHQVVELMLKHAKLLLVGESGEVFGVVH